VHERIPAQGSIGRVRAQKKFNEFDILIDFDQGRKFYDRRRW
jgi:hypothetical protein